MSRNDDIKFSKNVSSYLSLFVIGILAIGLIIAAIIVYMYIKSGSEPLDAKFDRDNAGRHRTGGISGDDRSAAGRGGYHKEWHDV